MRYLQPKIIDQNHAKTRRNNPKIAQKIPKNLFNRLQKKKIAQMWKISTGRVKGVTVFFHLWLLLLDSTENIVVENPLHCITMHHAAFGVLRNNRQWSNLQLSFCFTKCLKQAKMSKNVLDQLFFVKSAKIDFNKTFYFQLWGSLSREVGQSRQSRKENVPFFNNETAPLREAAP